MRDFLMERNYQLIEDEMERLRKRFPSEAWNRYSQAFPRMTAKQFVEHRKRYLEENKHNIRKNKAYDKSIR